jgi:ribonucleoside-diphosphate reductase alpha chain
MTTGLIGQRGRRDALMISMDISHLDIEDLIDIKTNLTRVTKANISVRMNDEFMNAVENNETYRFEFIVEGSNEHIVKEVMQKDYL